jgi:dihydrofolate reductase
MPLAPLVAVVAMSRNRVIGDHGKIPWDEPEDRKHFIAVTTGHSVIMGRKTLESLRKPLKNRRNLVITHQAGYQKDGCEIFSTLGDAIAAARMADPEPRIIGGSEIYAQALPLTTRIHLTIVDREYPGDAFFPALDERDWHETDRRVSGALIFRTLDRR